MRGDTMKKFTLRNDIDIPSIGFGTWKLPDDSSTSDVVLSAINCGYRHIDTAKAYTNERAVGEGIKRSNVVRSELFITGKLWNEDRGYERAIEACKETISNLKCDYLDLYLIHWPYSKALYENWEDLNSETWKALEYLYDQGLVKAIGVCNFKVHHLEGLMKTARILPMVNQIEFHPGFMQKDIVNFCKNNKIVVEAWSPLGSGKMLKKEQLIQMAKKYDVDVAQVCLKWCLQNGVLPVTKSSHVERIMSNLSLSHFSLKDEDMEYLDSLPYIGGSGLDSDTLTLFN